MSLACFIFFVYAKRMYVLALFMRWASRAFRTESRLLCMSFLQEGQTNYTFFTTNEARKITDSISCHSKNLIYLIECKRCHLQYIEETKRQLSESFGEHRRSILNHHQLSTTTPVSLHFNPAGHSINDVCLIPIELIRSKRDSVRKDYIRLA